MGQLPELGPHEGAFILIVASFAGWCVWEVIFWILNHISIGWV